MRSTQWYQVVVFIAQPTASPRKGYEVAKERFLPQTTTKVNSKYILSNLHLLSKKDQRAALQKLRLLVGESQREAEQRREQASEYDWLLAGVRLVVKSHKLPHDASLSSLRKRASYHSFLAAAKEVEPWLKEIAGAMSLAQLADLSETVARCLSLYVVKFKQPVPPTLDNLLRFYRLVPSAFEAQYPGYARAGMLPFVLGSNQE
jgi:hypothetical protein